MNTYKGRSPPNPDFFSPNIGAVLLMWQLLYFFSIHLNFKNMKTTVINSNGSVNSHSVNNKAAGAAGAGAALPAGAGSAIVPNKDFDKAAEDKKVIKPDAVKLEVPQVKADGAAGKAEVKPAAVAEKPARNLDSTIKLALDLHRRINQRGKLLETIGTLEAFEVAQQDDAEETDVNFFQGCTLTIEDDNGREFSTKNPFIIKAVAADVNRLCVEKLAEIESEIFIPA